MSRLDGGALLANKAGSAWTYALRDHQGSTRGLYDGNLTSVGSVEYTPYGESYAASGTSPRFQYTGKEWDATAKLYYFAYRYYSPERARWLTRDPLGMVDGPNVYAYVAGNPVNRVDPDGRAAFRCKDALTWCAAAAAGLIAALIALWILWRHTSLRIAVEACLIFVGTVVEAISAYMLWATLQIPFAEATEYASSQLILGRGYAWGCGILGLLGIPILIMTAPCVMAVRDCLIGRESRISRVCT